MADLLTFIRAHPRVAPFLPEEAEIPKAGREWVANMLQTLCPEDFQAYVREQERRRRAKIDDSRNLNVSSPSFTLRRSRWPPSSPTS